MCHLCFIFETYFKQKSFYRKDIDKTSLFIKCLFNTYKKFYLEKISKLDKFNLIVLLFVQRIP